MFGDEQSIGDIKEKIQKALLSITRNNGQVVVIETLHVHINVSAQGGGAKVVIGVSD